MLVDCANNLIGIRSDCDSTELLKTGYYLENLTGVNLKNASQTAEDSTGVELLQRAMNNAQIQLNTELLQHVNNNSDRTGKNLQVRSMLAEYYSNFRDSGDVLATNNERFYVRTRHKTGHTASNYWNLSKIELNTLYIFPNEDVASFTINVVDKENDRITDRIRTLTLGALQGGVLNEVQLVDENGIPLEINGNYFYIQSADLENISIKRTQYLNYSGCRTCGGSSYKFDTNEYFKFGTDATFQSSNMGAFFVSLNGVCNPETLLCYAYNYPYWQSQLGQLLWYLSGVEFFNEVIASNRENFYIQNQQNTEYERQQLYLKYNELKTNVFQNISNGLMKADKICYPCVGWKQTQMIS
jgi:hypothetical protein